MVSKSHNVACNPRMELRSKECIDNVLQPLIDHINLPINGSLTSKDLYHTIISMAVDKNSVHSISKRYQNVPCETSIRYHLKKLNINELIESNENILMQMAIKNLKPNKEYDFAIDYTNDSYYGKIDTSNDKYVIRGRLKSQQIRFTHTYHST